MSMPLHAQYLRLKQPFPDALLLFRLGDVYELYEEDARMAARVLGLPLTARAFAARGRIPMCPLSFRTGEESIKHLVARSYKVAIAEQIGDPRAAQGLIEREVVRIVSPTSALHPPITPSSRDDLKGVMSIAPDGATAMSAPPLPSPIATRRTATAIIQLALFDIDALDGDWGREIVIPHDPEFSGRCPS